MLSKIHLLFLSLGFFVGESVPLVVFGIAKIQRVQMLAELSGLKLEAELKKVHATGTHKKKVKGTTSHVFHFI